MIMAPEGPKLAIEPDAMQVFQTAFVMRIALDVVEDVARLRRGQQIKPLTRLRGAQFKRGFAGLA